VEERVATAYMVREEEEKDFDVRQVGSDTM
jgi:hypothetical protein